MSGICSYLSAWCVVERSSSFQNAIVTSKAAVFRVLIRTWEGCIIIRCECIDDVHDGVFQRVTNVLVDIVITKQILPLLVSIHAVTNFFRALHRSYDEGYRIQERWWVTHIRGVC